MCRLTRVRVNTGTKTFTRRVKTRAHCMTCFQKQMITVWHASNVRRVRSISYCITRVEMRHLRKQVFPDGTCQKEHVCNKLLYFLKLSEEDTHTIEFSTRCVKSQKWPVQNQFLLYETRVNLDIFHMKFLQYGRFLYRHEEYEGLWWSPHAKRDTCDMKFVQDAACQYDHVGGDNFYIRPRVYMNMCRMNNFQYSTLEYSLVYDDICTVGDVSIWTHVMWQLVPSTTCQYEHVSVWNIFCIPHLIMDMWLIEISTACHRSRQMSKKDLYHTLVEKIDTCQKMLA